MEFLHDRTFLLKVARHKVKVYYAALLCLDFETENPLARLEGKVVGGNLNVAANSNVRRAGSLSLVFDPQTYNIIDVNNLIAIDKKISISLGIKNPFYYQEEYRKYGEVLWFKQGVFIITAASSSTSTSALSVSVTFQDKMCLLNGTCGGTLPASVSFHDREIIEGEGDDQTITIEYPIIKDIIRECVHHFGGEHFTRISIENVPEVGRIVMEYTGSSPIHFATVDTPGGGYERPPGGGSFIVAPELTPAQKRHFKDTYVKGDNIGYKETPLTYPGELILKAGSTVTQVLDEIVKTLGNYQYYYDVDGVFHFQYKTNFLATGNTPLNFDATVEDNLSKLYCPRYSPSLLLNEFVDAELVSNISFSPNYSNIKNDFVYWGSRQDDKKTQIMVRYHLAIDKKPEDIPRPQTPAEALVIGDNYSLCHRSISEVWSEDKKQLIRYQFTELPVNEGEVRGKEIAPALDTVFQDSRYWFNWREELYRRALMAYGTSTDGSYYDEELMAEWRDLYDPTSTVLLVGSDSFEQKWIDKYGTGDQAPIWTGYRVEVYTNPEKIRYWLDFIDTTSDIGKFSINRIGRRTKVTEDSKVNEVFSREINDIIFIQAPVDEKEWEKAMERVRREYIPIGQTYAFVQGEQWAYFKEKNSYGTCFEGVRSQLYEHIFYNSSVSLTTIPLLYLDGNQMVHLNFPERGVTGDFVINTIGYQFGGQTMTLSLQEAMVLA